MSFLAQAGQEQAKLPTTTSPGFVNFGLSLLPPCPGRECEVHPFSVKPYPKSWKKRGAHPYSPKAPPPRTESPTRFRDWTYEDQGYGFCNMALDSMRLRGSGCYFERTRVCSK